MKNTLKIQIDSVNTLKEEVLNHSNKDLKKIYVIAGDVKETGYDIIEECLIDLKARKFVAFGIDKKNTTKKMLDNILKYTKNVYVFDNNKEVEFNSNIFVFEYENEAYIYVFTGSATDSLFETDFLMYNVITYDLIKDKKEYEDYIEKITKTIKDGFIKLTKESIGELIENKLIFTTKQYLHVVPSIAELLGKNEEENSEIKDKVEIPKVKIKEDVKDEFEIDLGNIDTIEESSEQQVEEINEANDREVETEAFGLDEDVNKIDEEDYDISDEAIDMENFAIDTGVVKIDKKSISKKSKKSNDKQKAQTSKKINLDKVSNVIMELPEKKIKGKDINKIKIPNYIKDMVPNFFEIMEEAKLETVEGAEYKTVNINLEIIDVNTSLRFVDSKASLRQKVGQPYIEIVSEKLADIAYEELDIARIIKLAKASYHIEIIPSDLEEYNLWKKLCTNNFRGSTRQYGLM